jgi:hypothetical protein
MRCTKFELGQKAQIQEISSPASLRIERSGSNPWSKFGPIAVNARFDRFRRFCVALCAATPKSGRIERVVQTEGRLRIGQDPMTALDGNLPAAHERIVSESILC